MGGIFVLIAAVEEGDVRYLMRGSDALGNLCGLPNQPNIPPNSSLDGVPWEDRTLVWYPVRLDGSISPSTSLRLGLCVSVCPSARNVTLYYTNPPTVFEVVYASSDDLGRCIPDTLATGFDVTTQVASQRAAELSPALDIRRFMIRSNHEMLTSWKAMVLSYVAAVVFSFAAVLVARWAARAVFYLTIVTFVLVGCAVGAFFAWLAEDFASREAASATVNGTRVAVSMADAVRSTSGVFAWLAGGIFLIVIIFVVLCVVFRKSIPRAQALVAECAGVVLAVPSLLFVSLVVGALSLVLCVEFLAVTVLLGSAASFFNGDVGALSGLNLTAATAVTITPSPAAQARARGAWGLDVVTDQTVPLLFAVNAVFAVWTLRGLDVLARGVVGAATHEWYYSAYYGQEKRIPCGALCRHFTASVCHWGCIAGVAVLEWPCFLLSILRSLFCASEPAAVDFLGPRILPRVFYGYDGAEGVYATAKAVAAKIGAARDRAELLRKNPSMAGGHEPRTEEEQMVYLARIMAAAEMRQAQSIGSGLDFTVLASGFFAMLRLLVVACVVVFAWLLLAYSPLVPRIESMLFVLLVVGYTASSIVGLFLDVFASVLQAVILCVLMDTLDFDGCAAERLHVTRGLCIAMGIAQLIDLSPPEELREAVDSRVYPEDVSGGV